MAEVRKREPKAQVVSAEEIRSMVQVEGDKQQLGCHSDKELACLAEIGGALGVERVIIGSLGRLGSTYVYSLKLVDVTHAQVLRSGSLNLATHDDDELLSATIKLVADLFPRTVVVLPDEVGRSRAPEVFVVRARRPHSHLTSILLGVADRPAKASPSTGSPGCWRTTATSPPSTAAASGRLELLAGPERSYWPSCGSRSV